MEKINLKILNRVLARNIVRFESFEDTERQSVCRITIGGVEAVRTHSLAGLEEEVLNEMAYVFWSLKGAIGAN